MDLCSSYCCVVSLMFLLLFLGLEARDKGCDPEFKANVEGCLQRLQGFPILAMNRTFLSGDWRKTEVICNRKLIDSASECVREEYAKCPQTRAWRSLCGFQNLHPDLLLSYGHTVCRHREVVKQHWGCQQKQQCSLRSCLEGYRSSIPSRLTVGMFKSPSSSPHCGYYAHTEYCHEQHRDAECPEAFHVAQHDIIRSSRPLSCSTEQIQRLKTHYLQNEINLATINNAASDWSRDSVRRNLIGCLILAVFIVWGSVVGWGV